MGESVNKASVAVPCGDALTAVQRSWLAVERMLVDPKHTEEAFAAILESRRILDQQ